MLELHLDKIWEVIKCYDLFFYAPHQILTEQELFLNINVLSFEDYYAVIELEHFSRTKSPPLFSFL